MAFFLLSMPKEPARVAVTVVGGVCRSPGPSLSAFLGLEGTGRMEEGKASPGSTIAGAGILVGEKEGKNEMIFTTEDLAYDNRRI